MSSPVRNHDKSHRLRPPWVALYQRTIGNLVRDCVNLTRNVVNFARQIGNVTRKIDDLDREVVNVTGKIDNFDRDVDEISPAFDKGAPVIGDGSSNVANIDPPSDNFAPKIVRPSLHAGRL